MGCSKDFEFQYGACDWARDSNKLKGKVIRTLGLDPLSQHLFNVSAKKPSNFERPSEPFLDDIEANTRTQLALEGEGDLFTLEHEEEGVLTEITADQRDDGDMSITQQMKQHWWSHTQKETCNWKRRCRVEDIGGYLTFEFG